MIFGGEGGAVLVFCLGNGGDAGGFTVSTGFAGVLIWVGWLTGAFASGLRRGWTVAEGTRL